MIICKRYYLICGRMKNIPISSKRKNKWNLISTVLVIICKAKNKKNNKLLKSKKLWASSPSTPSRNSTSTPTCSEVSTVRLPLFSFRLRKAVHHPAEGHPPGCQQEGHHRSGPIRNRQDRHLLHRSPPARRSQVSSLSGHHHGTNSRTRPTN